MGCCTLGAACRRCAGIYSEARCSLAWELGALEAAAGDQQLLPGAQKGISLISEEARKIIDWQLLCPGIQNKHWLCLRPMTPLMQILVAMPKRNPVRRHSKED